MNFKYINNFIIILTLFFLLSCNSVNFLSKKQNYEVNYGDVNEEIYLIDSNNYFNKNFKIDDFYDNKNINKWIIDKDFSKLHTFKNYNNNKIDAKYLISISYKDKIIIVNKELNFDLYNLKNYKFIKTINLNLNLNKKEYLPISLARIDNNFFISYSNGLIINFDLDGKVLWKKYFNEIIKTPIKIYNENIILLLSNKISSINPLSGSINWQFTYENNENSVLQSTGGHIIELNHLLFFILPNGRIGEIDTIMGEKNYSNFQNINIDVSINNSFDKLHRYNNYLSYFDQNQYLTTIDIGENKILLNKKRIKNINSTFFYNNSLFTIINNNYLKSYNIINQNLFWEVNLEEFNIKNDQIINVSSFLNSIIIFFKGGKIIELDSKNGNFISLNNLKINNINYIQFIDSYTYVYHQNDKITVLIQ